MNFVTTQFFVSCNSRIVKDFPSKKNNIGFEGGIDSYGAAIYTSAFILWQYFPENDNSMDSVLQDLRSEYFVHRMTIDPHPLQMLDFPIYYQGLSFKAGYYQSRYTFVATRYHHSWVGISGNYFTTYPYQGSYRIWYGDVSYGIAAASYVVFLRPLWWIPRNSFVETMIDMSSTQKGHILWSSLLMSALLLGLVLEGAPTYILAVAIIYNLLSSLISPLIHLVLDTVTGNPVLADIIDSLMNIFGVGTLILSMVVAYVCLLF